MNIEPTHCPLCKERITDFATCHADEPFTAYDPFEGLLAWSAYTVPKELLCFDGTWVHFRFSETGDTRLVKLLTPESGG